MDGEMLTIYLNRYADNQPISNAVLEVESGAFKAKLKAVASGVYQAQAAPLAKAGEHSLVIMLQSGEQSDLLDASLTVAASSAATESKSFAKWWPIVGGSAAVLLLLLVALRRRGGQTK
jgi:type II secretory pathway component PulF